MTNVSTRPLPAPDTNVAPSADQAARLEKLKPVADELEEMIALLYPYDEEGSPEVIWLRDIKIRYPLTNLGLPARQALAQARRINRSQRRHQQLGLCEFQIGVIFLYYQANCHYAAAQFAEARRQWQFVNETAAACLSHYAEGLAYYHEQEYEAALRHYSLTERLMRRLAFSSNQIAPEFSRLLVERLTASKKALLADMWPPEAEPEPEVVSNQESLEIAGQPVDNMNTQRDEHVDDEHVDDRADDHIEDPLSDGDQPETKQPTDRSTPIPDHLMQTKRYVWYRVWEKYDLFCQDVPKDAWLLVDTAQRIGKDKDHIMANGLSKLVVLKDRRVRGSFLVRQSGQVGKRIRLDYVGEIVDEKIVNSIPFSRDAATGNITLQISSSQLIKTQETEIIGVVVGIWQAVNPAKG